jgi:Resolvase, N terminal domain
VKKVLIKPVRCAIYTRVSTDHGLEQDFNSLDAQYDAAQAYIRSQAHAGWALIRTRYDDGGYSGGSTERHRASTKDIVSISMCSLQKSVFEECPQSRFGLRR